jgi:hypothetical protein
MTREDMITLLEESMDKADACVKNLEEIRAYLVNQGD